MPVRSIPPDAICDALPLGALVLDRELRVHEWNATLAAWTGVPRGEAVGRLLTDHFPRLAAGRTLGRLQSVFNHGAPPLVFSSSLHHHLLPIPLAEGGWMPQRAHARRLPAAADDASGVLVLVTIENLTQPLAQLETLREERRRLGESEASLQKQHTELEATNAALAVARDRAEHASRSKSEFLANMSHEIRTPLTAILGYASVLLDGHDPTQLREAAGTIRRNGDHLLAVVNDILDLSKIEAGRMQVDRSPCDVVEVARDVVSLMRVRAEDKSLGLRLAAPAGPLVIETDAIRLRQVLLNLVGNAIKFTNEGAVGLAIDWDADRGRMRFDVTDTGIGVDAAQLEAIFQPFNQADTSARRRFGGTGLGLTICRRLGEMLGGEVTATSTPGEGSTFSLALATRLVEGAAAAGTRVDSPANAAPEKAVEGPALAGLRVLVAEDGVDNQRLIRYLLEKGGAAVTIVENGQEAVDTLCGAAVDRFDVVLMDMQMPVLDGYNATRTLRERGHTGPVIALTAHAMDGDREKTLAAGCDDYATKPLDPPRLFALIRRHAAGQREPAATAL